MKVLLHNVAKWNLTRDERGRWVGALSLQRSVPVGVGACDEHPRMADGENVYFITDDFVHDAVGFDNQLAKKSMACLNLFGLIHNDSVCCFKEVE